MDNKELYKAAVKAIDRLYADRSVSKYECESNMKALIDELVLKINALGIPG